MNEILFKRNAIVYAFILFTAFCSSCKEKMTEDEIAGIGVLPCRKAAEFITGIGFDKNRAAFSTETDHYVGIILLEAPSSEMDTIRKYQHPSWANYGYMASITTDDVGNAYTICIPFINTLRQDIKSLNSIYKIDHLDGIMRPLITMPKTDSVPDMVAYGMLGVFYDCHGSKLYASSANGSTRDKEDGKVYMIDPVENKVLDDLPGFDIMGLGVGGVTGEKRLFMARARTPDIYSVELDKEGYFIGKPQFELTLDQLGPRGDDRGRKIRFNTKKQMEIYGIEFNFNLAGQTNKPETKYTFGYNFDTKKWINIAIE